MEKDIQAIRDVYSSGERFDEMRAYDDRKLKVWEEEVTGLFPANAKILDVGCGKGREAFCLNEKGFRVTGVDISETAIETARHIAETHRLSIDFCVSNGMDLPFPDSTFNAVIIWAQTFGLFYGENNQRDILNECKRVLKDGGILSFSGHDKLFLQSHFSKYIENGYFYPFLSDLRYTMFTAEELSDCAKDAGFQIISSKRGVVYTEADGPILHCECRK